MFCVCVCGSTQRLVVMAMNYIETFIVVSKTLSRLIVENKHTYNPFSHLTSGVLALKSRNYRTTMLCVWSQTCFII